MGNPGTDGTFPRFRRKQYQKLVNVPSVPVFLPLIALLTALGMPMVAQELTTPVLDLTFGGPPGLNNDDVIQSTEQCGGAVVDLADDGYNWHSSNTAVATLPTKTLQTASARRPAALKSTYKLPIQIRNARW